MDDTPARARNAPAEWLEILAESEAEADAGLFVDGEAIIRELYAEAERLEAEPAKEQSRAATRRR